jgi:hypothetical protein
MYYQCDSEGNQLLLLKAIVDHQMDGHAVHKDDTWIQSGSNTHMCKTTKGWHLCIQMKGGSMSWEKLTDIKESNTAAGIADESALIGGALTCLRNMTVSSQQ